MRMGKKRAVSRPILPMMATIAAVCDAGVGVMFRCDIWGKFYGENVRHIYHTIQDALREDFLQ